MRIPEMNMAIVSGRLTHDARVMSTQNGKVVAACVVAVNRRFLDRNLQEWKDDVVYVPVLIWGDAANRIKGRLKKGIPVYVQGKLTSAEYKNKEGQRVKYLQITASRLQILESDNNTETEAVNEEESDMRDYE